MAEKESPALGDLLCRHRERAGLTREELAALVEPPLSLQTIGTIDRGRTRPYRYTLLALCSALRLDEAEPAAELAGRLEAERHS